MAIAALKIKIMPDSPEADLSKIEESTKKIVKDFESENAKVHSIEIEDVAFGLKAMIVTFAWPEQIEQEKIEEKLRNIEHVESVEVVDFRRAVG